MKHLLKRSVAFILSSVLLLGVAGCSDKTDKAEEVAKDFLSLYFATDYRGAASCCTEELSKALLEAVEEYYSLEENVREGVVDISSSVVTSITSAQAQSADTVLVKYSLKLPDVDRPQENTLTIVKEDGGWRVARF